MYKIIPFEVIPFENLSEEDYAELEKNNKAIIDKVSEELTRLSKRGYVLPNELSDIIDKCIYGLKDEEHVYDPEYFYGLGDYLFDGIYKNLVEKSHENAEKQCNDLAEAYENAGKAFKEYQKHVKEANNDEQRA